MVTVSDWLSTYFLPFLFLFFLLSPFDHSSEFYYVHCRLCCPFMEPTQKSMPIAKKSRRKNSLSQNWSPHSYKASVCHLFTKRSLFYWAIPIKLWQKSFYVCHNFVFEAVAAMLSSVNVSSNVIFTVHFDQGDTQSHRIPIWNIVLFGQVFIFVFMCVLLHYEHSSVRAIMLLIERVVAFMCNNQ